MVKFAREIHSSTLCEEIKMSSLCETDKKKCLQHAKNVYDYLKKNILSFKTKLIKQKNLPSNRLKSLCDYKFHYKFIKK